MKKILVVEDDSVLRENISKILQINYAVENASDGSIAIEILEKDHKFDLIVSDIMMPNIDGYQLFEHIKNSELLSDIPFIFLSAKADRNAIRKGISLGADDYIIKPFLMKDLQTAIKIRIKKKEHEDKRNFNI